MRLFVSAFAIVSSLALPVAMAQHRPHQTPTPFPFRCPQAGICLQPTGKHNVIGGVRHTDSELRFHAIYLPGEDDAESPWCVAISNTKGDLLLSDGDSAGCAQLDQNDTLLFGVKPTFGGEDRGEPAKGKKDRDKDEGKSKAKKSDSDGDDDKDSDADPDDVDEATAGLLTHLAGAELQPDNEAAWAKVRALAQRWVDAQDSDKD